MALRESEDPTLADAIADLIDARLTNVHLSLPARVTSYDNAKQEVDVEVCVKRRVPSPDGSTELTTFPRIRRVPLDVAQTAGYFASFPVSAGDFVWLHFVAQSMDQWLTQGGVPAGDPVDRRFNLQDCFAVLARNPSSAIAESETDSLVIGGKGSRPRAYFQDSLITLGSKNPSEFIALAQKVLTELQKITTYLTAISAVWTSPIPEAGMGAPSAFATALNIASNAAGGVPSMQSVAASKVKAE